jgi:hypothetical protein
MIFLSAKIRKAIRESAQTFILAFMICAFAILLTFVQDFANKTGRPEWLRMGIEIFSAMLFIGDALVVLAVVARIVFIAVREFADEVRKK